MRRALVLAAFAAAAGAAAAPAMAGTPLTQTMTCPIGGASFTHTTTASYSTYGERPDGKPYGSWTFPLALPECPDNRLVLYKEYDEEEVARLEPLIASDAYRGLIEAGETQYYRAYWLMKEMGVEPGRYLWALLQAAWEADGQPERRARYLAEFAEATAAIEPNADDLNWIGMEARAANALRELGRFDEALARIESVPTLGLAIDLSGLGEPEAEAPAPEKEEKARQGWVTYLADLRAVVERQDASPEPLDMIPRSLAAVRRAEQADSLAPAEAAICEAEAETVAKLREEKAARERELSILGSKDEESGR